MKRTCSECERHFSPTADEKICKSCSDEKSHKNGGKTFWSTVAVAIIGVAIFALTGKKPPGGA